MITLLHNHPLAGADLTGRWQRCDGHTPCSTPPMRPQFKGLLCLASCFHLLVKGSGGQGVTFFAQDLGDLLAYPARRHQV
mmetsp:Transcript_13177/g.18354  ORF Transcript_13177/g.18354 Transcript_13177/m.18354 type:complete len:80 (-) Transcript_13177:366-605(-)